MGTVQLPRSLFDTTVSALCSQSLNTSDRRWTSLMLRFAWLVEHVGLWTTVLLEAFDLRVMKPSDTTCKRYNGGAPCLPCDAFCLITLCSCFFFVA